MASSLGISHQQLQKYETASNRISAGMLFELSKLLWVPVESFFQQGSTTGKKKEVSDSEDLRRECRFWVERTSSAKTLKDMAVVLEALSAEPGLRR
jgi:transcriptional regulator with XRE-family HTH domain